jgi:hypothetical protein
MSNLRLKNKVSAVNCTHVAIAKKSLLFALIITSGMPQVDWAEQSRELSALMIILSLHQSPLNAVVGLLSWLGIAVKPVHLKQY